MNTYNTICRKLHTAITDKARNEQGEVSSYLILAAGLGVAAVATVGTLQGQIATLAGAVGVGG